MLDIGYGSGYTASLIVKNGCNVTGVEFSDDTAVHAREVYNIDVVTNLPARCLFNKSEVETGLMTYKKTFEMICESFNSLQRSRVIDDSVVVSPDTVILGTGSELDSLGFVSFISDLEERLSVAAAEDIYLVLNDIHDFNGDNPCLTIDTLARFVVKMTQDSGQ